MGYLKQSGVQRESCWNLRLPQLFTSTREKVTGNAATTTVVFLFLSITGKVLARVFLIRQLIHLEQGLLSERAITALEKDETPLKWFLFSMIPTGEVLWTIAPSFHSICWHHHDIRQALGLILIFNAWTVTKYISHCDIRSDLQSDSHYFPDSAVSKKKVESPKT